MRQKQPASEVVLASERPVPYRLTFRTDKDGTPARLTSPLLDRAMHGRNAVACFAGVAGRAEGARIRLDPFEAASLAAYLRDQPAVRRELERELDDLLATWDEEGEVGRGGRVWEQTRIESVHFAPRKLPTPAQVELIKRAHRKDLGRILREHFDTPDSRSSFVVLMTPEWAQHLLMVQFRDGRAMRLEVHG